MNIEMKSKMDISVNLHQQNQAIVAVAGLKKELKEEGFDEADIKEWLRNQFNLGGQ